MNQDKELEQIKDITATEENVCACKECIRMCHEAPCLGTPTDILDIVKGGFTHHLVLTMWREGLKQNIPPIQMLQPYFDGERQCCTFMDMSRKHCTLHNLNLKPTEGRLTNHKLHLGAEVGINLPIQHAVALTWADPENQVVVMEIINEMKAQGYKPSQKTDSPS